MLIVDVGKVWIECGRISYSLDWIQVGLNDQSTGPRREKEIAWASKIENAEILRRRLTEPQIYFTGNQKTLKRNHARDIPTPQNHRAVIGITHGNNQCSKSNTDQIQIKYKDRMETRCIHKANIERTKNSICDQINWYFNKSWKQIEACISTSKVVKERKCIDKRRSNALVWYSPKVVALHNSVDRAEEEVASIYMEGKQEPY